MESSVVSSNGHKNNCELDFLEIIGIQINDEIYK